MKFLKKDIIIIINILKKKNNLCIFILTIPLLKKLTIIWFLFIFLIFIKFFYFYFFIKNYKNIKIFKIIYSENLLITLWKISTFLAKLLVILINDFKNDNNKIYFFNNFFNFLFSFLFRWIFLIIFGYNIKFLKIWLLSINNFLTFDIFLKNKNIYLNIKNIFYLFFKSINKAFKQEYETFFF